MESHTMTSSNRDLDLFNFLNEAELEKISEVLRRDQELKSTRREYLKALEDDIERLREIAEHPMSSIDEIHICHLCRQMCSWFVDQAEECPSCRRRVCKFCRCDDGYDLGLLSPVQRESLKRKTNVKLWSCTLCYKLKEYKVCSGQWMREGHSAKDNTPEINMNDSNALNKNRQLKTEISSQHLREGSPVVMMMDGEEMMINISLRGTNVVGGPTSENIPPKKLIELAKVEIPNGVHKGINKLEVRETPVISFETSRQRFQEYEDDDDELSAISEEVNDQLGRSSEGAEADLDVVEVHERYSHSENPSPHEVSSLTLYIRESSRGNSDQHPPRNIKITSSRSLAPSGNSTPSVDSFESPSPSTPIWDQNDVPVTKSILIKKLSSSSSNAPKSNSIKLLSVSSHQKESNMIPVDELDKSDNVWEDITEDYEDIRRNIISASQIPSARKNFEEWQSVNEFAPSDLPEQQRSSSWKYSENGYQRTDKGPMKTQMSGPRTTVEYSTTSSRELPHNPKGSFYRNFSVGTDSPKQHDLSVKERVERFTSKGNTGDKFTYDGYKRGAVKFNEVKKEPDNSKKFGKEVSSLRVDDKDEFESEEERYDFFYGGDGKLLIPISNTSEALNGKVLRQTETKVNYENMDKALDVIAQDMAENITIQATDDVSRMRGEPIDFEKPSYFSGIVVQQDQSDECDSSDPKIQHYYLNGVRRSYEKKFPIEDGWYKNDQGVMVTNGKQEDSDDDASEKVDNKKVDKPEAERHSSQEASTRAEVESKDEKDLEKKNQQLSDGSLKEFSSTGTPEQVDKSSSSFEAINAESQDSGAGRAKFLANDSTKNSTKSTGEFQALDESGSTDNSPPSVSQVESRSSEVSVADDVAQAVNQQGEKILGGVSSDRPESSQSEKEVELSEDELRRFLAKINRQIDDSIERHEKEREDLLTQQQVRLDAYVKELNDYIQENDEPALEEEEWVSEVEKIQNQEVRELLEEQQQELEEMEKVRSSILNHLGLMATTEDDLNRGRAGKMESKVEKSAFPMESELTKNEDIENDVSKGSNFQASDVEVFARSSRLSDYVNEITNQALIKTLEMKEEKKKEDDDVTPPGEAETNISQEDNISELADRLTRDVMNEVKLESERHPKDLPEKTTCETTSEFHTEKMEESENQKDVPIYSRIVPKRPKPSGHPSIDEKSQTINSFFNSGEEFDEVSKSTTTFGEEVSTTTTTVYKKEDDYDEADGVLDKSRHSSSDGLDRFAINSGSLLKDIETDLAKIESKSRHAVTANVVDKNAKDEKVSSSGEARRTVSSEEKWDEVEILDGALSSSDSPQLSSEGETKGLARQMDSMYTSRMAMAGEIHFGLKYEDKTGNLEIHVHQCKDIMGLGRTNPYVKTYLMPDKTRKGKRKTYPRKNTENPVFNEILKYKIPRSDLESRILSLTVWHNVTFSKNEILGEVVLPMKGVDLDDKEGHWYPIHQGFGTQRWKSILDLNHDSKLEVSLLFSTKGASPQNPSHVGDLRVKVIQAKSLTSFRENGSCDAFVECFLQTPLAHDAKAKSCTRRSTRNPEWNQEFCFSNVTREQLKSSKLEITVWTQEGFQEKEFLGGVKLFSGDDIDNPEVELWEKALNSPDKSFTAVLHLRSTMDELLMD